MFLPITKISDAPEALATPVAKSPVGPSPKIATVWPFIPPPSRVAYTAFPRGSWILAYSKGIEGSFFQQTISGITAYSAKQPFISTPNIFNSLQKYFKKG